LSYSAFLLRFLMPPLILLAVMYVRDTRRAKNLPPELRGQPAWVVLLGLVIVALIYTTPWDNYLVATQVWWYDPSRVVGLTLGWVPVEEYGFFILQTLMTGLWWVWLARHLPLMEPDGLHRSSWWWKPLAVGAAVWLAAVAVLSMGWKPGTYLALEFAWALPPIMLQLAFGADILWHYRWLVGLTILIPTLYLSVADSTAIGVGTWTFSPEKSSGWWVGGVLPVEEWFFFLLTNILIGFGMTLVMALESQKRFRGLIEWAYSERKVKGKSNV